MKNFKKEIRFKIRKIMYSSERKKLKNKDFTIISNNCWGGNVSSDLDVPHNSPFVGLFIMSEDYIKLCQNLEYYLEQELVFIEKSKYDYVNKQRENETYPLGKIGDVELNFQHYETPEEAKHKFNRRKKRIIWDNIFYKFEENFEATPQLLQEFDNLPLTNKVIFTKKPYSHLQNAIYFEDFSLQRRNFGFRKYFDVVNWLNGGGIKK